MEEEKGKSEETPEREEPVRRTLFVSGAKSIAKGTKTLNLTKKKNQITSNTRKSSLVRSRAYQEDKQRHPRAGGNGY